MLPNLLFGSLLIALSGLLLGLHARALRTAQGAGLNERDLAFARGQYRRRVQVGVLLALAGAAIIGGAFMSDPLLSAGYWAGVVLLAFWIGYLALADLLGARAHLQDLHDEQQAEHAALRAELAKYLPPEESDSQPDIQ